MRYYHTKSLPVGKDSVVVTPETDAVERGALGKTAFTIYSLMLEIPQFSSTAKELQEASKLSIHQVYGALRRLREFSLVRKIKTRYAVVPKSQKELDERVSKPAGTYGKGERRIKRHRWERARKAGELFYKEIWSRKRRNTLNM